MAAGRMEFHARTINQHTNFCFVLPNDIEADEVFDKRHYEREPLNLILLHGLTGTDTDWLYGGNAQEMAIQYNLNIFMPTTGNTFYLNKGYEGGQYADYIGEELPAYISSTFGIEFSRENTMIGGLSMGGYGAIHIALAFPDHFNACIALSSAIHMRTIVDEMKYSDGGVISVEQSREIFGDPDKLLGSDKNPEVQVHKLLEVGTKMPRFYLACGTEDDLIDANRSFGAFLKEQNSDCIFEEGPGGHNWTFWNQYLNRGLKALLA